MRRDVARSAPAAGRRNTGALARAIATDIAPASGTRLATRNLPFNNTLLRFKKIGKILGLQVYFRCG